MPDPHREVDSLYVRAKAQNMLDDFAGALASADRVMSAIRSDDKNPGFVSELLHFRFTLLCRLRPRGDPMRTEAAEQIAEHARRHDLSDDWAFGESALIEERMFSAAQLGTSANELEIERAQRVLAQISPESKNALRLQSTLVSAYAMRALSSLDEDDIAVATSLFEEIASSISDADRLAMVSNILLNWMRIVAVNQVSGTLLGTIERLAEVGQTILARPGEGQSRVSSMQGEDQQEASETCEAVALYIKFLRAELSADSSEPLNVASELESRAQQILGRPARSLNRTWIIPILFEASGHLYARLHQYDEAVHRYKKAQEAIGSTQLRASVGREIAESLYANLCMVAPATAFCEVARTDATAASWTAVVEKSLNENNREVRSVVQQALLAFERECLSVAKRDGRLKSIGQDTFGDSASERRDADVALRRSGLPEFDSAEFPLDGSTRLSTTAATVVLCSGRTSGYALIVPPGARVRDAISIDLPDYSARTARRLTMAPVEGWIPALLAWRSTKALGTFESALRRTAVRLWECAIGRVYEFLSKLGCSEELDLVVRGDQRLFPWGCASPLPDLRGAIADRTRLSTGFDLSTLLLGKMRAASPKSSGLAPQERVAAATSILVGAPFLGIPVESAVDIALSWNRRSGVLSITDGTADLPMTRLEGDLVRAAFPEAAIHLEGGIDPRAAPYLHALVQGVKTLHIACHGVWMPTHPWVSALMLGPMYALFAATVRARCQLDGSLVVLSACESGIGGPSAAGEGSLVQGFLLAGARSVIASSWMVQDLSSLVFANAFFAATARGDDVFAAMKVARESTREMTIDQLGAVVDQLGSGRPSAKQALANSLEEAERSSTLPFQSAVHWGAQFVAATWR
jgi:tetratricopeptide (TPR) repeat protein